ncbi:MAG: restriction endonuclease subunit S [Bacteroidales bacterium]
MNYNNKYPEYWECIPLIKLVDAFETGARPKGGVRGIENGIPSLGGEHLDNNGKFKFEKIKYVPKEFALSMKKGIIQSQDILLVKDGATTGKVSFVNDSFPFKYAVINEHLFLIRCLDPINSKFVYYYLYGPIGQKDVQDNFKGSAQGGINHSFSKNTIIPLPPVNEQNRIVEKLDALFVRIDSIKERMDAIPELIKQFRQSVLHAAVTGKLTEEWRKLKSYKSSYTYSNELKMNIPNEWELIKLKEVSKELRYGTSAKSHNTGKTPVLRMGNLQNGKIDWSDLKYSTDEEEIRKYQLNNGDVLFNRTNSPELVGKTVIYRGERPAIYAGYIIKIVTNEELSPEFLNIVLNSQFARRWCWQVKSDGVSQSNINAKKLTSFKLPLPVLEEQNIIVFEVNKLLEISNGIETKIQALKAILNDLPRSILFKAFMGELVPQDPNDEPAEKLLERILEEKTKLDKRVRKFKSDSYQKAAEPTPEYKKK